MYPRDEAVFADLRKKVEAEWVPAMQALVGVDKASLPALWDADFLYGPKTGDGHDTHILCEINASSVIPFPPDAPGELAHATLTAVNTKTDWTS